MSFLFFIAFALLHTTFGENVMDILENKTQTLVLYRLFQHCNLTDTILTDNVTIFAPNNDAFRKLSEDMLFNLSSNFELMMDLVNHHVVLGNEPLENEGLYPTLNGRHVRYNIYEHNKIAMVDGVKIIEAVPTETGMIYIIDQVLVPYANRTILDIVASDPDFSQSYRFMKIAKTENMLLGEGMTAFIPTDAGYAKLGSTITDNVAMKPGLLKEILGYHCVDGTLYSAGLFNSEKLKSFSTQGDITTIRQNNGYTRVNYATIIKPDIKASNGVLHGINFVLVQSRYYTTILSG